MTDLPPPMPFPEIHRVQVTATTSGGRVMAFSQVEAWPDHLTLVWTEPSRASEVAILPTPGWELTDDTGHEYTFVGGGGSGSMFYRGHADWTPGLAPSATSLRLVTPQFGAVDLPLDG